jgi:formylglycine-generating enzyme required for sulfatase activity
MVHIRGGCFEMGSPASEIGRYDDERQRRVCVNAFKLGKYEVTQAQWKAVMGNNPSRFSGCENCPVEQVSWNDVQGYIGKLNARTGQHYRLPTEAEWEYAARAGTTSAYPWGDSVGRNRANCDGCGSQWDDKRTAPVGSFAPNAWGLYDTAGNVWEWTCSAYDQDYGGAERRCAGKNDAGSRVDRGGSWGNVPRGVRSANRGRDAPDNRGSYLGFRLAQD